MKKILICLSFMIPNVAFSCPSLEGTWSSSKEKFESFNKRWANVDNKAWSFMVQTQGHEVITFTGNTKMLIATPELELTMGDRKIKRPSQEERINIDVLGCTDKNIVLKYERNGEVKISQLHFENDDTFWEYMGVAGRSGNGHIREYYTKIR
jgi:hypothetical protein